MSDSTIIPHLFRTEFRRIVVVLCRYLGTDKMEQAEDIAGEVFLQALETWPYHGIPANPTAWLYTVAKNKTLNALRRDRLFSEKISKSIRDVSLLDTPHDIDLTEVNIQDSQLKMMFVVCHPSIPVESQIALCLRILCGFGIEEIATAFLTNKETINKRLQRAKEKLKSLDLKIELPDKAEMEQRLESVLTTVYLIFSEGYYSESQDSILREDLCAEAMRLTYQLIENPQICTPEVYSLYALMCFHSSRFPARRIASAGEFILYEDQDGSLWDRELIARGACFMNKASTGSRISRYHLEAAIAYWHTTKSDEQKWPSILKLYDQLAQLIDSPIIQLNRIYAHSRCGHRKEALLETHKLNFTTSHFYFVLLGDLYKEVDTSKSVEYFHMALGMARTLTEKGMIQRRLDELTA